ncbi:TolC family protein [Nonlabens agnitus]|uniref:Transporter n=1 Tax=Nonlabens agnitus TaxID=870484 RepID=A0A2S9WXL6_9FLAO|nr:TolC family protein [Nonlabens agnitus]PRP68218.1 transporter [Nonlabens agnitus]PRP68440.1 transporter [Nonlabens agnitus]
MNKKLQIVGLMVVLFAFAKANSQQAPEPLLSRQQAVELMLQNNFDIQISENQLEVADNNKDILNSGYLPTVSGTAGANYSNTDNRTEFGSTRDDNGVLVPPRAPVILNDQISRRYNASIGADYLLFDGLGRFYNYKILQEQYNLTDLQVRQVIESTTVQLMTVYYEVARLTENLSIFRETLNNTRERETRAKYQFEYGQVNKLEVLNAQVDITTDSINILNAKQNLENAKRDLNLVMNREIDAAAFTVDTLVTLKPELEVISYLEEVDDNVRLMLARSNVQISEWDVNTAKALLLPRIGLSGSYGWNRSEDPESAFFPSRTSTSDAINLGATLTWDIFDGGRSITGIRNAKITAENERLRLQQTEKQVMRDIANARGNYQNAIAIYNLQTQNVETNQNNFDRSQERYRLGQITSIELRQAQINLVNARTTRNQAKYVAKLAEIQLLQLAGELLSQPL